LTTAFFFAKWAYYMFYCISYQTESELHKTVKIANQVMIFMHSIFLAYALFNHKDPKQHEFGYLTIFIIATLLVLNVVVTLNPITREDRIDPLSRGCCSSQNLMPTISFMFCFWVFEIHRYLVATDA
jgi:hypothetical protein